MVIEAWAKWNDRRVVILIFLLLQLQFTTFTEPLFCSLSVSSCVTSLNLCAALKLYESWMSCHRSREVRLSISMWRLSFNQYVLLKKCLSAGGGGEKKESGWWNHFSVFIFSICVLLKVDALPSCWLSVFRFFVEKKGKPFSQRNKCVGWCVYLPTHRVFFSPS